MLVTPRASAATPVAARQRSRGYAESARDAHHERTGLVSSSTEPTARARCDGLSSAATSTSMPNAWCHAMSPAPASRKITAPRAPSRYPAGQPSRHHSGARPRRRYASQNVHPALAANPL
jgi:hypothetical protein